jgi:hypothetical protein
MPIPNGSQAYVPSRKLTGYLLSESHAVGKAKARFFRLLGFDETNVPALEEALLRIAQGPESVERITTQHGTKYVAEGPMATPSGVIIRIRTIWIVEEPDERPRFVTAYPVEQGERND